MLVFGFDGGRGEVFLHDVADVARTNLVLCDAASFCGFGVPDRGRSRLQLPRPSGDAFYQAVLVVEGTLSRHAFHPVNRGYRSQADSQR